MGAATQIVTRGAKGVVVAGGAALAVPEIAVAAAVTAGVIVVSVSTIMVVGWLTGYGVSFRAGKDGLGFNIGPGAQAQAQA